MSFENQELEIHPSEKDLTPDQLKARIIEHIENAIATKFGANTKMSSPKIKTIFMGSNKVLQIQYTLNGTNERLYSVFIDQDGGWSVRDLTRQIRELMNKRQK